MDAIIVSELDKIIASLEVIENQLTKIRASEEDEVSDTDDTQSQRRRRGMDSLRVSADAVSGIRPGIFISSHLRARPHGLGK